MVGLVEGLRCLLGRHVRLAPEIKHGSARSDPQALFIRRR